jgi:hypothetical protein
VRPKPVATFVADQAARRARGTPAQRGEPRGVGELHPGRTLHQRLDDHRRQLDACSVTISPRSSKHAGSENAGARSTGKRSGSNRSVPNPPSPTDSAPIVSP